MGHERSSVLSCATHESRFDYMRFAMALYDFSIPCLLSHVHPKLFRVCQGSKCCEGTSTQIALFVGVWRFCKGLYCPEIFEILFLSISLALAGSVSLSLVAS